ncbi:four helix bundle protein [Belliella kenyensis]|uniref:Four helix bundle protein n=1 Tax=Belliella kenyensis TaxID=1472724 RepID=A0ABV8ENZ1_9BACT|nr:four helix bundle protein [Belliella kenyensis]MCH7400613.1 four helix bundle protein [Belliella kenyensis]MDN3602100.1 four helix bundle protein [Belliella kenyensis]
MERDLKARTKRFALDIIDLVEKLPNTISSRAIANQLIRSGTSVPANYRAATRGRSNKEFIAKLGVVIEEADESEFWLELIQDKGWLEVNSLKTEASELVAIFVSIVKKMKNK